MATDLVVAITLGPGDVQVVATDGKALYRVGLGRRDTRALHRMLLREELPYDVWVAEDPKKDLPEAEDCVARLRDARVELHGDGETDAPALSLATWEALGAADKAPGRVILTPGRLWRRLRELAQEVQSGECALRRVLLFHTNKGPEAEPSRAEPVASAAVVHAALSSLLKTDGEPAKDPVVEVPCLEGKEVMREWDAPGATRVRIHVANRVDRALADAARLFPDAVLRLHHGSGIPELSSVVQAAARFRFKTVEYRPVVEGAASRSVPANAPWITSADAFEARRRARELVLRGELIAADAVAAPFRAQPPGEPAAYAWAPAIEAVAVYFRGYIEKARMLCSKLPPCRTQGALASIIDPKHPPCLHTAMWTEMALLMGDIPEAIGLSVTFFDVALIDAAEKALGRHVDRDTREVQRSALQGGTQGNVAYFMAEYRQQAKKRLLPAKWEEVAWLKNEALRIVTPWQEGVIIYAIGRVTGRKGLADALEELSAALHEPTASRLEPARLRNLREHAWLTDRHIEVATSVFQARHLWHVAAGGVRSFLGTEKEPTLPCRVLNRMELSNSKLKFDKLLHALVRDIEGVHAAPLNA